MENTVEKVEVSQLELKCTEIAKELVSKYPQYFSFTMTSEHKIYLNIYYDVNKFLEKKLNTHFLHHVFLSNASLSAYKQLIKIRKFIKDYKK